MSWPPKRSIFKSVANRWKSLLFRQTGWPVQPRPGVLSIVVFFGSAFFKFAIFWCNFFFAWKKSDGQKRRFLPVRGHWTSRSAFVYTTTTKVWILSHSIWFFIVICHSELEWCIVQNRDVRCNSSSSSILQLVAAGQHHWERRPEVEFAKYQDFCSEYQGGKMTNGIQLIFQRRAAKVVWKRVWAHWVGRNSY
jgi:hypothetical protein